MVGTFYRKPTPDDPDFVSVGDTISEGQTLCIIEAMKVMNEIKAERSGTIVPNLRGRRHSRSVRRRSFPGSINRVQLNFLQPTMFKRVLVANRGEIALRIIRACRELGVESVAVYSEADIDSMHVQLADDSVCIGPGPSKESYLKPDRIIAAAEITGADAIHPGYGFLSENARFAEICESCNVTFIGPSAEVIRTMGDKNTARATATANGVPVTPGSDGIVADAVEGLKVAKEVGFPVMIKATAGGGGRGMRPAMSEDEFKSQFQAASKEAEACFNNGDCYIEKLVLEPHHIEFQVLADDHGNYFHLGERDCSMQRRNQKIIEECPSPLISPEMRERMGRGLGAFDRINQLPECRND
jgi:acetyl-CoA carboxylase biotin carboxylase subunit